MNDPLVTELQAQIVTLQQALGKDVSTALSAAAKRIRELEISLKMCSEIAQESDGTVTDWLSITTIAEDALVGTSPAPGYTPAAHKLNVHILLDVLAEAARGKPLDPDTCETVKSIAEEYQHKDFTADDVQALYDCGTQPAPDAWQEISTAPTENDSVFLVQVFGRDIGRLILQVTVFEGQIYPSHLGDSIDWDDRVTNATHWTKLLPPPVSPNDQKPPEGRAP